MYEQIDPCFNNELLHLDGETEAELPNETKEKKVGNHVILRNNDVTEFGETGFLLNQKTDSEALNSIYWYARKIKSFLGWEREDSQVISEKCSDTNNTNYVLEKDENLCKNGVNCRKESLSEELEENYNIDTLFSSENINQEIDKLFVGNCIEINSNNSIQSNVDRFSDITNNETGEKNKLFDEKEDVCNVNSSSLSDNIIENEIFRSEIFVFIESDKHDNTVHLSQSERKVDKETKSLFQFENKEMDKPLVQNNDSVEVGLTLNNLDSVLKNESEDLSLTSSNTEMLFFSNDNSQDFETKLTDSSDSNVSDETGKNDNISNNIVKEDKHIDISTEDSGSEKNPMEPSMSYVRKLSINIVKEVIKSAQNSIEDVINKKYSETEEDLIHKKESKNHDVSLGEQETEKYSEILSDEKSVKNTLKVSEDVACKNNMLNLNNSIKAHIQYKNEKNKDSPTKIVNGEKQTDHRKVNIVFDDDTLCGIGRFKPRWMQKYATAKLYVVLYSIIGILHGSYYSYLIGTLSTLEKRFAFKSKISGAIMIADEFTPLFLGVVIGYYAGKAHRPRLVAIGMLLSAGCCFATALPYFIYGPVQHLSLLKGANQTGPVFCDAALRKEACEQDDRPPTLPAVLFFVLGSFMKGFGNLAYYAIGLAYMDDNSEKKNTPLYLAVALALRLLGPLVGFLMSSGFLKFYENPFEDPGFGPDDPRWIGAWWIGFCLQGVLLVIFTLPIALFPKRLPSHTKPEQNVSSNKESMKDIFTGLLAALTRLAKNPIFIFMIINTVMKIFGHFGHSIMLPKYMENQFKLSASDASLFSGATSIACVMVSTVLGGLLIWKYKPSAKLLLSGLIAFEIISCLGYLVLMIPRCQEQEMLNFGRNDEGLILNSMCNLNCECSTTSFTPFCSTDGKTMLFSPCYAGCTQRLQPIMMDKERMMFGNCSCVADGNGNMGGKITEGFCVDENCWTQTIAYICILLLLVTIGNTLTVAHTMILLRSVHPNDKSVALGTFETFICLFGFIPFPVTFGALVDSACLVWEKSCGETGNCWFYDKQKYSYLLHGVSSFFCGMCIICLISLYCLSSRVRSLYEDEEDERDDFVDIKLDTVAGSVTKL